MSITSLYLQCSSLGVINLQELHRSMQNKGFSGKIFSFVNGHPRSLLDLATEISEKRICSQPYAGSRTVSINKIKGSEGRSDDFDCYFNPLQARTRDRWMRVAIAHRQGDTLPLVDLIQLGDDYFVHDGHHRISVARAFSEEYIDARVTLLELEAVPAFPFPSTSFGVDSIQQRS